MVEDKKKAVQRTALKQGKSPNSEELRTYSETQINKTNYVPMYYYG